MSTSSGLWSREELRAHLSLLRSVEEALKLGFPRAACMLFGAVYEGQWVCSKCGTSNCVWQTPATEPKNCCKVCSEEATSYGGGGGLERLAAHLRIEVHQHECLVQGWS